MLRRVVGSPAPAATEVEGPEVTERGRGAPGVASTPNFALAVCLVRVIGLTGPAARPRRVVGSRLGRPRRRRIRVYPIATPLASARRDAAVAALVGAVIASRAEALAPIKPSASTEGGVT